MVENNDDTKVWFFLSFDDNDGCEKTCNDLTVICYNLMMIN